MKYAYADPPYVNQAKKHYKNEVLCAEVNHEVLIGHLCEYFDGWALSCSSTSLKYILSLPTCPDDVRIASWVKPFASIQAECKSGLLLGACGILQPEETRSVRSYNPRLSLSKYYPWKRTVWCQARIVLLLDF